MCQTAKAKTEAVILKRKKPERQTDRDRKYFTPPFSCVVPEGKVPWKVTERPERQE
jgi:hypothetical protein